MPIDFCWSAVVSVFVVSVDVAAAAAVNWLCWLDQWCPSWWLYLIGWLCLVGCSVLVLYCSGSWLVVLSITVAAGQKANVCCCCYYDGTATRTSVEIKDDNVLV